MEQFNDVKLTPEFIEEYEQAPARVTKRFDTILRMILDSGQLPNSLRKHRTDPVSNLWIGYLTVTGAHWRVLFTWNDSGTLIFMRLLNHNQMDSVLKRTDSQDRRRMIEEYL